jgi:ATP phosphoribosyltransferase
MTGFTLAIPSKGRLKDNVEAWLADCGYRLKQRGGARSYVAELAGLPGVDVLLLSAREIAEGLLTGRLHVGVTGEDLLHDLAGDLPNQAHVIRPLGFGRADVVVAVPQSWLDVTTMADLEAAGAQFRTRHGHRMRVATKYGAIARRFFAARSFGEYRLVESAGATEAAPAAGTAELIVDITTSGATLAANDLKVLEDGVMLKSQAALTGSLRADWTAQARAGFKRFLDSVEARARADGLRRLSAARTIPAKAASEAGLDAISGTEAYASLALATEAARSLCEAGLGPVSIEAPDFVFAQENAAYDDFLTRI